jgi:hypothetical protein
VFLSSTCFDLLDLRQELRMFLESNGFTVALSEDPRTPFIVDPLDDSIASCLHNVENSDVLVCIIDGRYGGVLKTPPYEGLCATQLEVRHARSVGVPCFVFVRHLAWLDYQLLRSDLGRTTPWVEPDDPDHRRKWVDFVTEISAIPATKGISNWRDTFSASTDLKGLILKRLADHFPEHRGVIAMRPDRLVRLSFFYHTSVSGDIRGRFRNVGIGPALNITHGVRVAGDTVKTMHVGALGEKEDILTSTGGEYRYEVGSRRDSVFLFCEYDNRFGDRYRVEVPFSQIDDSCYKPSGPENFCVVGEGQGD